jgi:hypothetical protein
LTQINARRPYRAESIIGSIDEYKGRTLMSATGLSTFDKTLQETNAWLGSLMDYLHTDDLHAAHVVLRATLHALRDRIGPENAVHLGPQLPILPRGVFYEGWQCGWPL